MLNATLHARPVLSTPANVLLARAAAETSSTSSALKYALLELTPSTDLANIVPTHANHVSDQTPHALPVPMERSFTQDHVMINVPS